MQDILLLFGIFLISIAGFLRSACKIKTLFNKKAAENPPLFILFKTNQINLYSPSLSMKSFFS